MAATYPPNDFARGFIASEAANQTFVKVPIVYIDINDGNLHDAIIFSQIMYWHGLDKAGKPRLKVKRDGHLWLAKGYSDWWAECRVPAGTARKAIARIKKRGLIVTSVHRFNGLATLHIRVNWDEFEARVKAAQADELNLKHKTRSVLRGHTGPGLSLEDVPVCPLGTDRSVLRGRSGLSLEDRPLTETTTETTTDEEEAPECSSEETSVPSITRDE